MNVITTPFGMRGYAPLAPHVVIVEHADLVDALRARPVGWAARGERMPDALSDYAWGKLGARLGERFTHELALAGTKGAA